MTRFLWLIALGIPVMGVPGQGETVPIRVWSTYEGSQNKSVFRVRIENVSNQPIEELRISRIGTPLHHKEYRPPMEIKIVRAKGTMHLTARLRGEMFPPPESEEIGFEAVYRQGKKEYWVFFPNKPR